MAVEMQPVVSTNVAAIGYDERAEEVHVEFITTGLYVYSGVPLPIWQEFEVAGSKGEFVNKILKPGYPVAKM